MHHVPRIAVPPLFGNTWRGYPDLKRREHLAPIHHNNVIILHGILRLLIMRRIIYGCVLARLTQIVLAAEPSRPRGVGPDRMAVSSLSLTVLELTSPPLSRCQVLQIN